MKKYIILLALPILLLSAGCSNGSSDEGGTKTLITPSSKSTAESSEAYKQSDTESLESGENADCKIKGNISSSGEKIYHVPGGQYYNQTQINTSKGERWFCSTSEATAAGWRASKR